MVILLGFLALGLALVTRGASRASDGPVGLFTTLPILWNEAADVAGILKSSGQPHWARAVLARRGGITPLDSLAGQPGHAPLDRLSRLILAQPRPLSPQENVALDNWVRGGGKLLLFADPALTAESAFAIGDPRRPQAVALLSPILHRWGLELQFDESQSFGEVQRRTMGGVIPVNLPGRFAMHGQPNCRLWDQGLLATCAIGKGRVVALADSALLENEDNDGARTAAFGRMLDTAFVGR